MQVEASVLYKKMKSRFGFRDWWAGETKFEIFIGAILVQQTSWRNVKLSLNAIKKAKAMDINLIASMNIRKVEKLVRQSGFYRQKAKRIKQISKTIIKNYGSLEDLFSMDKKELRNVLLSMDGIGKETADCIVLYAADKPAFVIDAYTKRIMSRVDYNINQNISYDDLQKYFEHNIQNNLELYKDFHAQFVELGKNYCKPTPKCYSCPLRNICDYSMEKLTHAA